MNRRKYIPTLCSLAAGSAAMMGIGAFTSASAERSVSVQVAGDESAFLAMRPCDGSPSGAYVDSENGSMQLDLTSDNTTSAGGEGVNADAKVRCCSGGGGGTVSGPTNGLAHYWPLDSVGDDTAEDIVGGSDGTVSGGKNPQVVGTDDNSFRLYVENDYKNNADSLSFDIDDGPRTDSPDPVDDGEWYHRVGTYDGSTARLYLDGHEVDWTSASISPAATGVFIGERVSGLDPLNGAINDVRIYDRALSAEEVTALYNATNLPLGTTSAPDGRERGVRRGRARPLPTLVHDGSIPSVGFA
jgi:hypothetical protein